ncbi:hypothetical protein BJ322DRAFT_402268 [Thelephora terrestris]|uniref:Uncharacterized protein n=1 Tax=Thelephora terrestris TaxID=56493 RepID=A0A9P6HM60_9AGAM|nr:hypothetical protein BJ322DRAFT_402268 [Thelephora terrestris]
MNLNHLWAVAMVLALSAVYPQSPGVWAQSPPVAASCNTGWEWNQNSLGQDPCHVASILQATCRSGSGTNGPQSLNGSFYTPPQEGRPDDLRCECDTVTYSILMACMTCQGGQSYSWITWAHECDTTYVAQYPFDIPRGTAIPRWAFYNITTLSDQCYNVTVAEAIGRDPEATHKRTGGSGNKRNAGVIAVGVVGSVVLLMLPFIVVLIIKRRMRDGGHKLPRRQGISQRLRGQLILPTLTPTSANLPRHTYNIPINLTAFPPPTYETKNPPTYVNTGTLPG